MKLKFITLIILIILSVNVMAENNFSGENNKCIKNEQSSDNYDLYKDGNMSDAEIDQIADLEESLSKIQKKVKKFRKK